MIPLAAGLMSNPQVRQYAKKLGMAGLRGVVRSAQRRRARRGKKIMLPGIFGVSPPASRTATTSNRQPAKMAIGQTKVSGPASVADSEITSVPLIWKGNPDVDSILVALDESMLWPKLYDKAKTFTRFDMRKLVFEFVPGVGTSTNGTLYTAFTKDFDQVSNLATIQQLMALPTSTNTSVSLGKTLVVPTGEMNGNGKNLIRLSENANASDLSLYSPGVLFYAIDNCNLTAGSTIGQLRCWYDVTLRQPQADLTDTSAYLEYIDGALSVTRKGRWPIQVSREGEVRFLPNAPMHMCYLHPTSADTGVLFDDVVQTAEATWTSGANTLDVYPIGPRSTSVVLTTSIAIGSIGIYLARDKDAGVLLG